MLPLFNRDLTVAVLASGSTGNCTYVGDGHNGVLVDCGLSTKRIHLALERLGLAGAPIDAVLITHEHSDHIGSARVLSNRLKKRFGRPVPFYMTAGTEAGARERCLPERIERCRAGVGFRVGRFEIEPFPIPHDVQDPVAYRVQSGQAAVAVVTDLGRPTALVARKLREVDVAVLEFNHDPELLVEGPYPWHLKQRIRSSHGHLSNAQAGELLADALHERLRHLARPPGWADNTRPALGGAAARRVLGDAQVHVQVAGQHSGAEPIALSASAI